MAKQRPNASKELIEFKHLFENSRYANKPFTKEIKTKYKDMIKLIKSSK
jgi:hypothetical protein